MTDHARTRRWWPRRPDRVVLVALVAAVGYLLYDTVDTQVDANAAVAEKKVAEKDANAAREDAAAVADPLADLCARDPEVRRQVGALCEKAAEVKDQPDRAPRDGRDGVDGRGIAGTSIRDGRLFITYTDGAVEDKGRIVGQNGQPGKTGAEGRSITGTAITDGSLALSYSDGTTENVGRIVGADGRDGRGVAGVAINGDFRLIVTYTDGETVDVGPLPSGRDGRGIASVAFDLGSCTATVTYSDGAVEQSPMTGCEPDEPDPEPEPEPPLGGLLPGE